MITTEGLLALEAAVAEQAEIDLRHRMVRVNITAKNARARAARCAEVARQEAARRALGPAPRPPYTPVSLRQELELLAIVRRLSENKTTAVRVLA